jgi:hypothetical protein
MILTPQVARLSPIQTEEAELDGKSLDQQSHLSFTDPWHIFRLLNHPKKHHTLQVGVPIMPLKKPDSSIFSILAGRPQYFSMAGITPWLSMFPLGAYCRGSIMQNRDTAVPKLFRNPMQSSSSTCTVVEGCRECFATALVCTSLTSRA